MSSKKIIDINPPEVSEEELLEDEIKGKANEIKSKVSFQRPQLWRLPKKKESEPQEYSSILKMIKNDSLEPTFKTRIPNKKVILTIFFLSLTILAGLVALSILPMEIKIWPVQTPHNFQSRVIIKAAVSEPDFAQGVLPGEFLETEGEINQQFKSSGVLLKMVKAEGVLRVYNNYHLGQILVANTRFLSSDGKLFRSKKRVYIPSGTSVDVEVIADEPGPEYNIPPTIFSVPGLAGSPRYTVVFGKSFSSMKGGAQDKVAVVTEDDLRKAEDLLKEKVVSQLKNKIKTNAEVNSRIILDEAICQEVVETSSSAKVGEEVEQFTYGLKMKLKGLSFRKEDLESFAKHVVLSKVPADREIVPASLKLSYQSEAIREDEMVLSLNVGAKTYSEINTDLLKRRLVGKKLKEGKELLLQNEQIFTAQIKILPFWKRKFPENPEKVKIKLILD